VTPSLLAALIACGGPPVTPPDAPDLVVVGLVRGAPGKPAHQALIVDDGVVTGIVSDEEGRAAAGPETIVLEAPIVTPGFVDAHAHPIGLGQLRSELDLTGVATYAEALERIAAAPGTGWITGRGWDQNDWPDAPPGGWPLASDLDARVGARPVALRRIDGHALWVNGAALAAGGIDGADPDPVGGRILKGAAGEPSGVLVDTAMELVPVPAPDAATREAWALASIEAIASVGLTGVHAMGMDDAELATWEGLAAAGKLPIRLRIYVSPGTEAAKKLAASGPWGDETLRVVGVKAFADGALGSRGALLSGDYHDEPGHRGLALAGTVDLAPLATEMLGAGAQVAVHTIGDAACTAALDAFAAAREAHPERTGVPLRIEHAQIVRPEDRPRFDQLFVVASVQPTHATSDMPWAEKRLGPERIRWAYAWKSLAENGAPLAFGSDFPIESPDPGLGLWAATRRTDLDGRPLGGWYPDESVSLDTAIEAFTRGAARAVAESDRYGAIRMGHAAALPLWREDERGRWHATATVVAGRVVWRAP